jgi:predicted AAA+ superfamily ATPase
MISKPFIGSGDLNRRKSLYRLAGLSFREYLEFNGIANFEKYDLPELLINHQTISGIITRNIKIIPLFKEYPRIGFYPFDNEDPASYCNGLLNIMNVVIETDIPAVSDITFETSLKLKKLLASIASTVPCLPNLLKLRQELAIADQRTLLKYLDFLERSGVIDTLTQKARGNRILENLIKSTRETQIFSIASI